MKRLAILALVFGIGVCLASISWGQHFHQSGFNHTGFYRQGGSRTTVVVGFGNAPFHGGWGYGHHPYYVPRVSYYQHFGNFGYPVRYGYQRPFYPAPGCGYGYGGGHFSGGGAFFRW